MGFVIFIIAAILCIAGLMSDASVPTNKGYIDHDKMNSDIRLKHAGLLSEKEFRKRSRNGYYYKE